jgi:ABC-2 type transport system permease protein
VKGFIALYRREVAGLFLAPLAWILLFLALLYQAYFFLLYLGQNGGEVNGALAVLLGGGWPFWYLVLFVPPLLTMRMISEESRSGLLEFLLTSPVSDAAVVASKACAATTFLALQWGAAPLFGLVTLALGAAPDWGQLFTEWLGATLVSALFSAIGLVSSALCGTPLVAAFLAIVVNIGIVYLPLLGGTVRGAPRDALSWVLEKVDVLAHYQGSFLTGALDSAHVVFFLAWILALLFLAVRIVESRRWLG